MPAYAPTSPSAACTLDGIVRRLDGEFFKRLPNPDKQFTLMAGIPHLSFQQKNYLTAYHTLHAFFTQPAPLFRG